MKKKNKQKFASEEEPRQPQGPAQDSNFSLEEILREFGGGENAPAQNPPEAIPQSVQLDPALQSPIPRHRTVDPDPETQRPNVEHTLPERHIPPRPAEAPDASQATPIAAPSPVKAPAAEPASPEVTRPEGSHPPRHKGRPVSQQRLKSLRPLPVEDPLQEPTSAGPAKASPRQSSPPASPPHGSHPPAEPVWVNSASRRQAKAPEKASAEPPRRQPPRDSAPKPASSPPKAPAPKPPPSPEAQFRDASQRQRGRPVRLGFCLFFALGALALGFCRSQGYLDFLKNQKLLTASEMGLLFLCTLLAYDVPRAGLRRPLHPGFNFHSLVTLEVAISLADGFLALAEGRITYCPLVCLQLAAALWGLFLEDRATCAVMDTARKGPGTLTLVREPNLFQKLPGVLPGTGSEQEFLQANRLPAGPARLMDFYALAVLLLSAAVAGLTCRGTTATFFQYWTAVLLAGTPLAGAVAWSRPWCILSRRLQARGAALYGWTGACRLSGKLVVPISDQDLFPGESVKMNGVKYFGGHTPDQVVAYGSAVISAAGSGLSKIFEEQLEIRGARRYSVSKLRRYEVGGVGAEIGPDSVLVGSLRLMQSTGVDMPAGTRVSQAVYVAINGSLAGVFAVHYEVSRAVVGGLGALILSRGILPVITAGDFIITESFLRSKFRVNTARLKIPPFPARSELSQRTATEAARPCALLRQAPFSTISLTVTGARALRTAVRWGVLFDLLGGVMGMVIMAVLANLAASGVMSLVNLTLFLLLWSIPSLLLSGWPKNV